MHCVPPEEPKSPIELLPADLRLTILYALPDLESLEAVILTCRSLYYTFLDFQSSITKYLLLKQINLDILPEAVALLESCHQQSWDREQILGFFSNHFTSRNQPLKAWSIPDALVITRFHSYVRELTADFIAESLTLAPFRHRLRPIVPQREEIARIERAFYRYEIYCNLFRSHLIYPKLPLSEQRQMFFSKFSPWENEQLACVRDYLFRAISPAFNEMTDHDVEFAYFGIRQADMDGDLEPLLSLGLINIHTLILAQTYEQRSHILTPELPYFTGKFLHDALKASNGSFEDLPLHEYTPLEALKRISRPFYRDPDTGPKDVWEWAHQNQPQSQFVYCNSQKCLRAWGYVMWNRLRFDSIDLFSTPWQAPHIYTMPDAEQVRREDRRRSYEWRKYVYIVGGRGWWSFEDGTRVVYKNGKFPGSLFEVRYL